MRISDRERRLNKKLIDFPETKALVLRNLTRSIRALKKEEDPKKQRILIEY